MKIDIAHHAFARDENTTDWKATPRGIRCANDIAFELSVPKTLAAMRALTAQQVMSPVSICISCQNDDDADGVND